MAITEDGSLAKREEDLHKLYAEGKRLLGKGNIDVKFIQSLKNSEEASFLIAVSDFFLQQKQREVVARGIF